MDRTLLKKLYLQYYQEIYVYIFSYCKNRDAAEDLTQETFLKALLSLRDTHENMRAWLYKVARNLSIDYLKKRKQYDSLDDYEEFLCDEKPDDVLSEFIKEEEKRNLYYAINSLERRYREVLVLQYFGELSQKEIARTMHLSPENVRVLAHRAKQKLKEKMGGKKYDIS